MKKFPRFLLHFLLGALIGLFLLVTATFAAYHLAYQDRIYPQVFINHLNFSNWEKEEIENYFENQNLHLKQIKIHFLLLPQDLKTTQTAEELARFDAQNISQQAFSVGRSGLFFNDLKTKIQIFFQATHLHSPLIFADEKIKGSLQELEKEIYLPPEDALFQFENGKVVAFKEEKEGLGLDLESALDELKAQLQEKENPHQFTDITINLKTKTLKPTVTLASANSLGIHELLGEGNSWFSGSPSPRLHNIKLASAKLNGILVKPQAIFSFNHALGDVSQDSGYQPTWIIKSGRTILGDGGGVCQVSTTVFRAALNSGLPIVERQAHAYRVHYYEEKSPLGLDATVYEPSPDLKFLNDTPSHILIQSKVNEKEKKLTFQFYGTSDGRKVTLSEPVVWDKTPPPEPLYEDDPSLPAGTLKQVDWPAAGAKVKFDYTVSRNEAIIFQKTFTSVYQPWRAVYLRSPGNP